MSRECAVTRKQFIRSEPGKSNSAYWQDLGVYKAIFHQFVTETGDDNSLVTMAVVEYPTGMVETVPLSWITMEPMKTEDKLDYVLSNFVENFNYRLRETLHECSSWFQR